MGIRQLVLVTSYDPTQLEADNWHVMCRDVEPPIVRIDRDRRLADDIKTV